MIDTIFSIAQIWMLAGLATAFAFLCFGIDRIDEDARGTYFFRLLLIPAIILLWPLVIWRWIILEKTKNEITLKTFNPPRKIHKPIAIIMAIAIPCLIAIALYVKQPPIVESYIPEKLATKIPEIE